MKRVPLHNTERWAYAPGGLIREDESPERKKAKRDLERLEAERRHVELGLAMQRRVRRAG